MTKNVVIDFGEDEVTIYGDGSRENPCVMFDNVKQTMSSETYDGQMWAGWKEDNIESEAEFLKRKLMGK